MLQERQIERLGSNRPIDVDVRFVSATLRPLEDEIKEGRFREDLFFRINTVPIHLPPLRERREDIPLIVDHTIRELSEEYGGRVEGITSEALEVLSGYPWPGNVRQLKNTVESMMIVGKGPELVPADVPAAIRQAERPEERSPVLSGMSIQEMERRLIENTLRDERGNRERAAAALGISERTLYRKIKAYELQE